MVDRAVHRPFAVGAETLGEKVQPSGRSAALLRLQDELLRPTETQRDTLGIISKRYFFDLQKTAKRHRTELQAIVDSMRREIEPLLTPEQLERFKRPREGFPGPGWRPMRIPRQPHLNGRKAAGPPAGTPPPPPEPQE